MSNPKQHHFVPRAYLELFRDPQFEKPLIWQFDQEDFRIINTNPKSVAKRTHYYSVEHNGEKLSDLEDTWHPGPYSLPSG